MEKPPSKPPIPSLEQAEKNYDTVRPERINKLFEEKIRPLDWLSDEAKDFVLKDMLARPNHIWGDVNGLDMHFQSIKKNEAGDIEIRVWSDDGYMLGPDIIKLPKNLK